MRCHYIYDKEVGKVLIPGCYQAAMGGMDHCVCYHGVTTKSLESERIKKLQNEIKELERENARLNRIIKKLINKVR